VHLELLHKFPDDAELVAAHRRLGQLGDLVAAQAIWYAGRRDR